MTKRRHLYGLQHLGAKSSFGPWPSHVVLVSSQSRSPGCSKGAKHIQEQSLGSHPYGVRSRVVRLRTRCRGPRAQRSLDINLTCADALVPVAYAGDVVTPRNRSETRIAADSRYPRPPLVAGFGQCYPHRARAARPPDGRDRRRSRVRSRLAGLLRRQPTASSNRTVQEG